MAGVEFLDLLKDPNRMAARAQEKVTGNNYVPVFLIAGSAYLVAILTIHLLAPKLSPVNLD